MPTPDPPLNGHSLSVLDLDLMHPQLQGGPWSSQILGFLKRPRSRRQWMRSVVPHSSSPSRESGSSRSIRGWLPSRVREATTAWVTSPNTKTQSPIGSVECNLHSKATGDSNTLGTLTVKDSSRVKPAASNSLTSGGKLVPVALTSASRTAGARLTTNSRPAVILRSESFPPRT
jgi:hypothetical protein